MRCEDFAVQGSRLLSFSDDACLTISFTSRAQSNGLCQKQQVGLQSSTTVRGLKKSSLGTKQSFIEGWRRTEKGKQLQVLVPRLISVLKLSG